MSSGFSTVMARKEKGVMTAVMVEIERRQGMGSLLSLFPRSPGSFETSPVTSAFLFEMYR